MSDDKVYLRSMKRYEALFREAEDMIIFFNRDGRVCEMNKSVCRMLGCDPDEELYMHDVFRTCMELQNGVITLNDRDFGERFETVAYRKNQTCFSVVLYTVRLPEETECYGMCLAHDIVKQKETTKELLSAQVEVEEAHKERNELVANVTHELRTPVNGVMGLAQNLLDTELTPDQRESIEIIDQCCKNMIKIINNILDFSKLQAGKFTIENAEFSFHSMMDKMVKVNMPQAESKGLKLICNVGSDIPDKMIGDELRITQVLNNLLSNAIKFTSVGQVTVNVIKSIDFGEELELFFMVIDSGIGIDESERDKLFKSFSQVDASITRRFGGTGLGLSIVKSLVEMMGGDINVESEKGKGSTFSFSVHVKKIDAGSAGNVSDIVDTVQQASTYSFNYGDVPTDDEVEESQIYKLGSYENLKEIDDNMEKLVLCIEMENWNRANNFADNLKQLVAEDAMNLKRKAFRLQMTVRKGDHNAAIEQYEELKEAINQFKSEFEKC